MTLAERLRTALADGHACEGVLARLDQRDPRIEGTIALATAAVLIAVTDRPEPGLILTQRAATLRSHAGQVAFPGGKVDDDDADEIAAALREAEEEIGLPRHMVEVIGPTDRFASFTGFDIVPILGVIPPDVPLVVQAQEVDDWFEVPLAYALNPANRRRATTQWNGATREFYEIFWQERRIWGITAAILANLSKRLGHE